MKLFKLAAVAALMLYAGAAQAADKIKLTAADYTQIYQLYSAYSDAIDTGDGPGRIATFTPDGLFKSYISKHQWEHMDTLSKRTSSHGHKDRPTGGHMQVLIHITPTGPDTADGTCYAILGGGAPDADGNVTASPAFYTDTLVKTANGWRFKTREVFIGVKGDKNF